MESKSNKCRKIDNHGTFSSAGRKLLNDSVF